MVRAEQGPCPSHSIMNCPECYSLEPGPPGKNRGVIWWMGVVAFVAIVVALYVWGAKPIMEHDWEVIRGRHP